MESKKNPVPSTLVYFDEKELQGVMCVDGPSHATIPMTPCTNYAPDVHGHTWQKTGWMSMSAFVQAPTPKDIAARFVKECLDAVVGFRDGWQKLAEQNRDLKEDVNRLTLKSKLSMEANDLLLIALKMIIKGEAPSEELMERARHLFKESEKL